ncbi:Eco57I restriction-modification methylase domain-containing protein [Novispirillum itersonii]|uniref:Eco57I restriction-modification methylase domain-containing protein n=1 Tax=Novispirillum itersonii TaxID=189 RepID=UPI000374E218|nr:DNA methyltransferase [Novispirillum itersonii]
MNLFNRKTLERHIKAAPIPQAHLDKLEAWAEMIRSQRVYSLKEVSLHGQFAANIVEGVLGYRGPAAGSSYTVATEETILRGSVDLALGHFGGREPEILAPFELKGADTRDLDAIMPGRNKTPVQQAWEYAMNARGVKWVLVSNMIELRLYGFGEGTTAYEVFQLDQLTDPKEYARFMLLLSAESLLSGRTLDLLKQSRAEDRDITDSLYQDYKALRLKLIGAVQQVSSSVTALESIAIAQKILDRVLFIAFAEDTGLLPSSTLSQAFVTRDPYNPRPVWDNFKGLFHGIDQGSEALKIPRYNGGLFHKDDAIDALSIPDDICEGFKALGEYDFASEVSVTVLGHIFEQSIADVERLQAQARGEEVEEARATGTTGRRRRDGVVYTPDYIARFIVAETLGAHLEEIFTGILGIHAKPKADLSDYAAIPWRKKSSELEAWQAYRERLKTLRIVDPACGSGVFLIMAFDFLKAELTRVNEKIKDLSPKAEHYGDLLEYVPDSEILTNNLFGVDVNVESIEIAKLSLWIKTARRGKVLDSLDSSLCVGDSLIEDSNFAYLDHAFTWETAFPHVFAEGGFDVVLGNPPYVRMEQLKAIKPYLEKRYEVVSDRADLYCYFFERGLRLLKPGGRLGYISSNTFFKTGSGKPLREYLLREATLESVIDFGDLQIFEGVTTYPAILTMKRAVAPEGHDVQFWKVDALPEANFQATWEKAAGVYPQAALSAGSWELEKPHLQQLRMKIAFGKPRLQDVYDAPLYGIKTGLNKAFVIDDAVKERICSQDPKSIELLKPFLEGKDIRRWRAEPRGLWGIMLTKGWTRKRYGEGNEAEQWERLNIEFPGISSWLSGFYNDALKRSDKGDYWWELRACDYIGTYDEPKIIFSHFQDSPSFFFDDKMFYTNNRGYIWKGGYFEVAILNSKAVWFFLTGVTSYIRGGFFEATTQNTTKIPIPSATDDQKHILASMAMQCQLIANQRLALQTALTRRIPDLCPPDRTPRLTTKLKEWWTLPDFAAFRAEVKRTFKADIPLSERSDWEDWITRDRAEIARLSAEITQAEAQIDKIVYQLFDLTPDEIALLESVV